MKYYNLLSQIEYNIINNKGKIFIYHKYVNNSGTIFIEEVLKANGILDETSTPTSNTLCSICYKKEIIIKKNMNLNLYVIHY